MATEDVGSVISLSYVLSHRHVWMEPGEPGWPASLAAGLRLPTHLPQPALGHICYSGRYCNNISSIFSLKGSVTGDGQTFCPDLRLFFWSLICSWSSPELLQIFSLSSLVLLLFPELFFFLPWSFLNLQLFLIIFFKFSCYKSLSFDLKKSTFSWTPYIDFLPFSSEVSSFFLNFSWSSPDLFLILFWSRSLYSYSYICYQ